MATKTLRERIGSAILGQDLNRARILQDVAEEFSMLVRYEPIIAPEVALSRMAELDPRMVDMFRMLTNYEIVGSFGQADFNTESVRKGSVNEANVMYDTDVLTQYMVNLWTDFGFGLSLEIIPRDDAAQEVWDEFWHADRNAVVLGERVLHDLSNSVLNDGEVFFSITVSTFDGKATIRTVPSLEIAEIIYDPDDSTTPVFYKRVYNPDDPDAPSVIYYPDWRASEEVQKRTQAKIDTLNDREVMASDVNAQTIVGMVAAQHRKRYGRGWPLLRTGFSWSRGYKKFAQDRLAVEAAAAAYLDKVKGKGGSRAIDAMRRQLESTLTNANSFTERNPSPAAGSTWIENDAVERTRLQQGTGAADADTDANIVLAMVGLSGSIYPHYLGKGDAFRLATTSSMEAPAFRSFNRYRNFWASVWADITKFVITQANLYGEYKNQIEDMDVDVAQDAILSQTEASVAGLANVVTTAFEKGVLDPSVAQAVMTQVLKTALAALGIRNVDDIMTPPPAPPVPPTPEGEEVPPEGGEIVPPEGEEVPPEGEVTPPPGQVESAGEKVLIEAVDKAKRRLRQATGARAATEATRTYTLTESLASYERAIENYAAALWRGDVSEFEFVDAMVTAVDYYMREAWNIGAAECSISPDDMTEEEKTQRSIMASSQFGYIPGLAAYILSNNRASGAKLGDLQPRLDMWSNRYRESVSRGQAMACYDLKARWAFGGTVEHCDSCQTLVGQVRRMSFWQAHIMPQDKRLACRGYKCNCRLVPTDASCSHGRLPGGF